MKNETITDFKHFKIGTVFNRINPDREPSIIAESIQIRYPSRLNAMAIDPSKITENNNMIYTPGEIVFSIGIFITVKVKLLNENVINISNEYTDKNTVIKHICLIMKDMLNYSGGFQVTLIDYHPYRHCGFGSTGCLQAAVASCINHLLGQPFDNETLIKLLARNYGEEIDGNDEYLNPVQCIGGSASSGLMNGGVIVVAGENTVIAKGSISDDYRVLIGIPKNIEISDSVSQFNNEKENLHKFNETGLKHKNIIAYQVLHKFLPAIYNGDLSAMGDVIFDYRYNMGSIQNCSYTYKELPNLMSNLAFLKKDNIVDVLSISSVGPAIFIIADEKKMDYCRRIFEENNLTTIETCVYNHSYHVEEIENEKS